MKKKEHKQKIEASVPADQPHRPPPARSLSEEHLKASRELRGKNQRHLYSLHKNLLISILAFLCLHISKLFYCSYRTKSLAVHSAVRRLIADPQSKFIIAFWHNRLFYLPSSIRHNIVCKGHDVLALISPSRDGELATRIAVSLGAHVARGSSSRKGINALREILRYLKLYFHPLFVADGPRGPRYVVKEGLPFLARTSGLPVLPLCYAAQKAWFLSGSWDRFSIPKPFSRIAVEYGEPIYIPKEMELEKGRLLIEKKMRDQMKRLESIFI